MTGETPQRRPTDSQGPFPSPGPAPGRPSKLAPDRSFFPGTWCQDGSCGGEDGAGGRTSGPDQPLSVLWRTGGAGVPRQGHPSGEMRSLLCVLVSWESQVRPGPWLCANDRPGASLPSQQVKLRPQRTWASHHLPTRFHSGPRWVLVVLGRSLGRGTPGRRGEAESGVIRETGRPRGTPRP